jgi:hypothetical protein
MKIPMVQVVEWVDGNKIRLFFSSGKISEVRLPDVEDASGVEIVDEGCGIDPGDGVEFSSCHLAQMRGKVWVKGKKGFVGSSRKP